MMVPYIEGVSTGLDMPNRLVDLGFEDRSCECFILEGHKAIRRLSSVPKSFRLNCIFGSSGLPNVVDQFTYLLNELLLRDISGNDYIEFLLKKSKMLLSHDSNHHDLVNSVGSTSVDFIDVCNSQLHTTCDVHQFQLDRKRIMALDILINASSCIVHDRLNSIRLAYSIENAVFSHAGGTSNDMYYEKVHDIATALAGKKHIISIIQKMLAA